MSRNFLKRGSSFGRALVRISATSTAVPTSEVNGDEQAEVALTHELLPQLPVACACRHASVAYIEPHSLIVSEKRHGLIDASPHKCENALDEFEIREHKCNADELSLTEITDLCSS